MTTKEHQHSPVNVSDFSTKDLSRESSGYQTELKSLLDVQLAGAQKRKRNYSQQWLPDITVLPDGARIDAQSNKSAAAPRVNNYDATKP